LYEENKVLDQQTVGLFNQPLAPFPSLRKMKARDIFGLVIRLVGLALLLYGLWYLTYAIADALGMHQETPGEMAAYFTVGIPSALIGVFFLRCARHIVHFSYPGDKDDSDKPA
jgi:hypothetical protein